MDRRQRTVWYEDAPDLHGLPKGTAPTDADRVGSADVPFRVFLHERAWRALQSLFDEKQERIGWLLGRLYADEQGPFALIDDALPAAEPRSTASGVTWTSRSWDHLARLPSSVHRDRLLVGGFRVRPGRGAALSPYDEFAAKRHFPQWHHLLYVVDPDRQRQGMFHWEGERLSPLPGFWVHRDEADAGAGGAPGGVAAGAAADGLPTWTEGQREAAAAGEYAAPARRPPSWALLGLLLLLLLLWAFVADLPGSLPGMRRQIEDTSAAGQRLAAEADALRQQNERLLHLLEETEEKIREADGEPSTAPLLRESISQAAPSEVANAPKETPAEEDALAPVEHIGPLRDALPVDDELYIVRQGDTLWAISHRLFGDPYIYLELAADNDIEDPDLILPGWELRVPPP